MVSIWCRDIVLTQKQRERLVQRQIKAGNKGRLLGAEVNRRKKLENIALQEQVARNLVGTLTKRDKLMLGIGLYWGEGVKSNSGSAAVVNSDPAIIQFTCEWLRQLGISKDRLRPRIYISEHHKARERRLINFWSKYLSIPKTQFGKTIFLKGGPKKVYENHNSYYGIVALRVARGTSIKYKILGLIKECKNRSG